MSAIAVPQHAQARKTNGGLLLTAVSLGTIMVGLDGTAFTIVAPYAAKTLHTSLDGLSWLANGYLLALAVVLLPAGNIVDRLGRRRSFLWAVLAFGALSLGILFTNDATVVLLLRIGQGVAAGFVQPAALALLRNAFSGAQFARALGVWAAINALAIAVGPGIAGIIVQHSPWATVFAINAPIAVIAAVLIATAAKESTGRAVGIVGAVREVLGTRERRLAAGTVCVAAFALFLMLFVVTLDLQNMRALSPMDAGLWLLGPTCFVVLVAPIAGIWCGRGGVRPALLTGLVVMAVGIAMLAMTAGTGGYWAMVVPMAVVTCGIGFTFTAASQMLVGEGDAEVGGMSSAVQQIVTQLGGLLGIGVGTVLLSQHVSSRLPSLARDHGLDDSGLSAATDEVAQGRTPSIAGVDPTKLHELTLSAFSGAETTALLISAVAIAVAVPITVWQLRRSRSTVKNR